ncbi:hypothetical protein QAD02_020028 [Eretmocerus hayati]|uniref:Uncharacterized protein n=1 Tax=Eretmocerus hayati TaxID=131215 RepID=A0ACC2PN55_9HYME|nr:hypothetical protein QAD02_020028 [Eretmocerus hayati]
MDCAMCNLNEDGEDEWYCPVCFNRDSNEDDMDCSTSDDSEDDEGIDEDEMRLLLETLTDNTALKAFLMLSGKRSIHAKEMNTLRIEYGQYYTLLPILKKYPEEFRKYMRMSIETFDYILKAVAPRLEKNWNQLHKWPIRAEERLVVTIRLV